QVYKGNVSYLLGITIEACISYQSSTDHPDPIHLTAYFLRAAVPGPCEIVVRTVRTGKALTNLVVELCQNETVVIMVHAVFGILDPAASPPPTHPLTLTPPNPYAPLIPFHTHPSLLKRQRYPKPVAMREQTHLAQDHTVHETHEDVLPTVGGVKLGFWSAFTDQRDTLAPAGLLFLADPFSGVIARLTQGAFPPALYPTVTLSVEFKAPISRGAAVGKRTVGVTMGTRFVQDPQGRHDLNVELWTVPVDIGEGEVKEGWREEQRCLAIARHMTLTVPVKRKGKL
ncbi:thioesterase-like superfamily-domain-containing protein, partial [Amylostereum chailletii]